MFILYIFFPCRFKCSWREEDIDGAEWRRMMEMDAIGFDETGGDWKRNRRIQEEGGGEGEQKTNEEEEENG